MSDDELTSCEKQVEQYKSKTKPMLAYLMLGIAFIILLALIFVAIPEDNKDMLNFLLGSICGFLASIYSFYFGDSEKKRG